MWYFSGQGSEMSDQPGDVGMLRAMGWGMYYHLGSIALGSLLIGLLGMIRAVFEYLTKQYEAVDK
jgi:hypothetical protein